MCADTVRRSHKAERSEALERNVLRVFGRANRTIMPSPEAWHRPGDPVSEMAKHERLEIARISKAFANDILLALMPRVRLRARHGERSRFFSNVPVHLM